MTLQEMQYFVSIAKCGTLTGAAKELYLTQPTLSKFIAAQEKIIGAPLFKRVNNRYIPTYLGQRYLERAQAILGLAHSLDLEISELLGSHVDHISLGFTAMRIALTLPDVLPVFKKMYPNVEVDITVAHSMELEEKVLNGSLDAAFITTPAYRKDLNYEMIFNEEFLLAAPPNWKGGHHGILTSQSRYPWVDLCTLKNEPFIYQPAMTRNRQMADKLFLQAGFLPKVVVELENVSACLGLVASGYGFSFVSESLCAVARLSDNMPQFFSVGSPPFTTSYCGIYRTNSYLSKYTRCFINLVKNGRGA
ncbi:LysR family transcriptional regulator [Clostridium sp. MCC353]|uniref:LysR family transcriptional regulator n=1 Tax=Clostridium sp. MCC353 TaxID=2592646 RepID=UPI001C0181A5|nr:LysR family transcriptional regulator [Clostridium sp. MCC353]